MSDLPAPNPADAPLPPPSAAAPAKRSVAPVVFGVLAGVAVGFGLGAAVFNSDGDDGGPDRPPSATVGRAPVETFTPAATRPTSVRVVYKTGGTAPYGDITYKTPTGIGQKQGVDIPLTLKSGQVGLDFDMQPGDFVSISVQNGTDSGTVTCSIEVDGKIISSNSGSGAYAIASCDGTA